MNEATGKWSKPSPSTMVTLFKQRSTLFLIIAFSIFIAIKFMNKLRTKEETPAPAAPPALSKEEVLMTEIPGHLERQTLIKF